MVITFIVQGVTIGAYSARLAGVQTKRIATSISLFNLLVTTGRLANLFMGFFVGPLSDEAGNAVGQSAGASHGRRSLAADLHASAALDRVGRHRRHGRLRDALADVYLSVSPRRSFVRSARLGAAFAGALGLAEGSARGGAIRTPADAWPRCEPSIGDALPRRLLIFNTIVMCVYSVGVQASFLASVLDVNVARTAITLSGIVNGIGTIAFTLFVDPTSAMITDQAIHGKRSVQEVRSMVFYLTLTAIIGSLLSQAILYPAAVVIEVVSRFAAHVHI